MRYRLLAGALAAILAATGLLPGLSASATAQEGPRAEGWILDRLPPQRDRADWRRDTRRDGRPLDWRDRAARPDLRSGPWLLPLSCLQRHFTRQGEVRLFEIRCLEARYGFAHRLPLDCATTIRSRGRMETGFDARCLRHEGFRVSDRH